MYNRNICLLNTGIENKSKLKTSSGNNEIAFEFNQAGTRVWIDNNPQGYLAYVSDMPYISTFKNQKRLTDTAYTAEFDCMAYVYVVTNATAFGSIIISINGIYVRQYQNPTTQQGLADGTLVALKKGDTISVSGSGLKSYSITVQY